MPIVDVELVHEQPLDDGMAGELADILGRVFDAPPATTWVRLRALPKSCYAENEAAEPTGWKAVFVTVRKAQRPAGPALEAEIRALTDAVAQVCRRPAENVHVLYEPDLQGRIAFGGRLRE
jgi:phenylpyruvate tautomerase PptA (4-oxalocrotonate tautomerase family)